MVKFGCFLYQDGMYYEQIRLVCKKCEELGFDSFWLKDNLTPWLGDAILGWRVDPNVNIMECLTTLSALASETSSIRLGAIFCNTLRNPHILSQAIKSLIDVASGRLDVGLSAGWHEPEHTQYGIAFMSPRERVDQLREGLHLVKRAVVAHETAGGRETRVWVGGAGHKTIRLAAEVAYGWNYGLCTFDEYASRLSELNEQCRRIGRDPNTIVKAWQGIVDLSYSKSHLDNTLPKATIESSGIIVGDPQKTAGELARYLKLGVSYLTLHFVNAHEIEALKIFAEKVMPAINSNEWLSPKLVNEDSSDSNST